MFVLKDIILFHRLGTKHQQNQPNQRTPPIRIMMSQPQPQHHQQLNGSSSSSKTYNYNYTTAYKSKLNTTSNSNTNISSGSGGNPLRTGGDNINNNLPQIKSNATTSTERVNDLIVNLDHELPEIRLRALKCILRKIDCGIISTKDLCDRVDLLYRLTDFLQPDINPSAFEDTFDLLTRLSAHEEFREVFVKSNLDTFLIDLRDKIDVRKRSQIDSLLKTVGSILIQYEDHGEVLNKASYSGPSTTRSRSFNEDSIKSLSLSGSKIKSVKSTPTIIKDQYTNIVGNKKSASFEMDYSRGYNDYSATSNFDNYTDNYSRSRYSPPPIPSLDVHSSVSQLQSRELNSSKTLSTTTSTYGVPKIVLEASDRRVLNSTVESLLSKNESLIFITTCFFRDVLLHDFPPETFIQESSVVNSILQIVQDTWEDDRLIYVAFQSLMKLSKKLRCRIACLDSTSFYRNIDAQQTSQNFYNYERGIVLSSTDNLAKNICEILRNFSRAILYTTSGSGDNDSTKSLHWILMDTFSYTLFKLIATFKTDVKSLSMNLQEILLDLAHVYSKNYDRVNPSLVALIYSSLLSCSQDEQVFILTSDVRRCIRTLASDSRLAQSYPDIYKTFLAISSPFEPTSQVQDVPNNENENSSSKLLHQILYGIQNATEHQIVLREINNLWEYVLGLSLNSRFNNNKEQNQEIKYDILVIEQACKQGPWRETFSRFLSVEPTSHADEELLFKVLDILTFILSSMTDPSELTKWIFPICFDNTSAGIRMISELWQRSDSSSGGTMLQTIVFSWMDFYNTVISRDSLVKHIPDKYLDELFTTLTIIYSDIEIENYVYTAMLTVILEDLSILTANPYISKKIEESHITLVSLLQCTANTLNTLEERSELGSHRNIGLIQYDSQCIFHLFLILKRINPPLDSSEWIIKCVNSSPFIWGSECAFVRATSFDITRLILSMEQGLSCFLLSLQNSAQLIWIAPYNLIIEPGEIPIVKQKALEVILVLLNLWKNISENDLKHIVLPNWNVVQDLSKLLGNLVWHQNISQLIKQEKLKQKENVSNENYVNFSLMITPGVLSAICNLLKLMNQVTTLKQFHSENFMQEIMNSGVCTIVFRIIGNHEISKSMNESWWIDCCSGLINALDFLIEVSKNSRNISLILIGDRLDFSRMMNLFKLESPIENEITKELLSNLWGNIFTLLTHLCSNAGNTFEDLEKNIWTHRDLFFPCLKEWLSCRVKPIYGKIALDFLRRFLSFKNVQPSTKNTTTNSTTDANGNLSKLDDILNEESQIENVEFQKEKLTYGSTIAHSLIDIQEDNFVLDLEQKVNILETMTILFTLSPTAKQFAIDQKFVGYLVKKIEDFGVKFFERNQYLSKPRKLQNKSTFLEWHTELNCILGILTSLFYDNKEAKDSGLEHNLGDILHKIFKWHKLSPDRELLHSFLEVLINFTDEFPKGSYSLIVTSDLLSVPPRKVATPQSIFVEILNILNEELEQVDKTPNLKTINLIFAFLRNCMLLLECRNIIVKCNLLNFTKRLHINETKKWGQNANRVKGEYLEFLVQLSFYSDMQLSIAKVPETLDILILLVDVEPQPFSSKSLKILRNLCFNQGNRVRFYCDSSFMPAISAKLRTSEELGDLESAAVGLSALIANSEKGKLLAKKAECSRSLGLAITRVQKMEKCLSNDPLSRRRDLNSLIDLLGKTYFLLNGSPISPSPISF